MKNLLLIVLLFTVCIYGCKKDRKEIIPVNDPSEMFPKTELVNTAWKAFSFNDPVTHNDVYDFIHFTSSTTVDLYSADITGKTLVGEVKTYPLKITLFDKNMDRFEITFPDGKVVAGYTSGNANVIEYNEIKFNKVN